MQISKVAKGRLSQTKANVQTAVHFVLHALCISLHFNVQILHMNFDVAKCSLADYGLSLVAFIYNLLVRLSSKRKEGFICSILSVSE